MARLALPSHRTAVYVGTLAVFALLFVGLGSLAVVAARLALPIPGLLWGGLAALIAAGAVVVVLWELDRTNHER